MPENFRRRDELRFAALRHYSTHRLIVGENLVFAQATAVVNHFYKTHRLIVGENLVFAQATAVVKHFYKDLLVFSYLLPAPPPLIILFGKALALTINGEIY
ncbi:putative acetyltransferase [Desulfobacca acetoxidans DSM 11109]|uniref:Putative acetyltransferase n=1 Tax=Desulfobacca acetoxidans (strain ATCC 700848 / DSM 11109 / ASRB2) TaxID=880072 RepID=F2NJF2_DESAR|nr:putative acetyltransferase [Desulfobacca acetoxidans DSM 11109]